jgi:hypothetical protein
MAVPAHVVADTLPAPGHLFVGAARVAAGHRLLLAVGGWWLLYAVAVMSLLRAPRRAATAVAVLTSAGVGIAALARRAVTSNDFYRYVWDGRVQAAGVDPYRYAPAAPQLDRLHDPWLWPSPATCAVHLHPPGCTLINRATVHTIYPPLAQLWFLLEHFLVPQSTRDAGYEAVGLLLAVAATVMLLLLLRDTGRDIRQVAIWGCCPAVALEAVQSAHVDALAVVAVLAAVWAAERGHWAWASAAVGAAGLIKLYPLVLFPAIVQRRRLRGAVIVVAMFVVAYLPHVIAVGQGVTGFLSDYVRNEGYVGGRRYQLLHVFGLQGHVAAAVAALAVVGVLTLALLRRLGAPGRSSFIVFAVVLFVATPGEPWENLPLVALAAVVGGWQWLSVTVAEELGYISFIYGGLPRALGDADYGIALAFAAAATWLRRLTRSRHGATRIG